MAGERRRFAKLLVFALCALLAAASMQCAPKKGLRRAPGVYDLRYDMPVGAEFILTAKTEHMNQRVVMGNELVTNSTDLAEMAFTVQASNKHGLTTELEYRSLSHETDAPQAPRTTDFSELVGRSAQFVLSPKGELSGFVGFDELPEIEIVDAQRTLTEDMYIYELKSIFPEFPEHAVKRGDSWSYTREFLAPMPGGELKVAVEYTYTVMEETRWKEMDCVKFRGKHTTTIDGHGAAGGLDFQVKMTGTGLETAFFSWEKGMFLGSESATSVEGAAENADMGVSIPMRQEYRSTVSVNFQ